MYVRVLKVTPLVQRGSVVWMIDIEQHQLCDGDGISGVHKKSTKTVASD